MKKCFLFFALVLSINLNAQSISVLGNYIIETDDFNSTQRVLVGKGFYIFSDAELNAFGHNPSLKIIGTKGNNPSNSIMVNVTAKSKESNRVKNVVIICPYMWAIYIEEDLFRVGYQEVSTREYIENKKFNVTEVTYQRIVEDKIDKVVVKYGMSDDGTKIVSAEATFERKDSNK